MTDHKDRELLGAEAQKLIDNPILRHAFQKAKDNAVKELTSSNHDEQELREHQYIKLKAINDIEQQIHNLIRDGEASRVLLNKKPVQHLKSLDN